MPIFGAYWRENVNKIKGMPTVRKVMNLSIGS